LEHLLQGSGTSLPTQDEAGFALAPTARRAFGETYAAARFGGPGGTSGADDRVGPALKRGAADDAAFLRQRVLGAIFGATFGVHAFAVSIAPVFRRLPVTVESKT
jgi:hypothetical protein